MDSEITSLLHTGLISMYEFAEKLAQIDSNNRDIEFFAKKLWDDVCIGNLIAFPIQHTMGNPIFKPEVLVQWAKNNVFNSRPNSKPEEDGSSPISSKQLDEKLIEEKANKILSQRGKNAIQKSNKYKNNIKLKEEVIRLYNTNTYKNPRQASIKIVSKLKDFAKTSKIPPLSDERSQQTIYSWLLNYKKSNL